MGAEEGNGSIRLKTIQTGGNPGTGGVSRPDPSPFLINGPLAETVVFTDASLVDRLGIHFLSSLSTSRTISCPFEE